MKRAYGMRVHLIDNKFVRHRCGKGLRNATWFYRYGPVPVVPCCYCQRPLAFKDSTLEHYIPLSLGGTNEFSNRDIACRKCNNRVSGRVNKFLMQVRAGTLTRAVAVELTRAYIEERKLCRSEKLIVVHLTPQFLL